MSDALLFVEVGGWSLAMILLDAVFGVPGLILAPVIYAWVKSELVERGLV